MTSFDWTPRWGYLVLPAICLFGCFTNLINIAVLLNSKMKDITFKYILATSLSDLVYLFLCSYSFIEICSDCPLHNSYFTQIYIIFIDSYFTSCLAIFVIFIDIAISLIRYSVLKNKTYLQSLNYYLVILFLFLLALIYYLPVLFFYEIMPTQHLNQTSIDTTNQYPVMYTSLGSSLYGTVTPIIESSIRIILAMFVLTSINIMNAFEFRKRYSHRIQNQVPHVIESNYKFVI